MLTPFQRLLWRCYATAKRRRVSDPLLEQLRLLTPAYRKPRGPNFPRLELARHLRPDFELRWRRAPELDVKIPSGTLQAYVPEKPPRRGVRLEWREVGGRKTPAAKNSRLRPARPPTLPNRKSRPGRHGHLFARAGR